MTCNIENPGQTVTFHVGWLSEDESPVTVIVENWVTLSRDVAVRVAKEAIATEYSMRDRPSRDDVTLLETKATHEDDYVGRKEIGNPLHPLVRSGIWM